MQPDATDRKILDLLQQNAQMTIKEIAETIISMTGSKSRLVYKPLPTDDPKQRRPDITRARTLLGWEPKVQLEEGLVKTIEYFRGKVR